VPTIGANAVFKFRSAVRDWYQGKYVPPKNDPSSDLVFTIGDYERHWTATAARTLSAFWFKDWKWIIGAAVTIAALIVNATR
jgi:hypothetical protein